jgi:hypothetical protein
MIDTPINERRDRRRVARRCGRAVNGSRFSLSSGGASWDTVTPFVTRFNRAKSLGEKLRILDELGRAIEQPRE